jgi:hypothetical protein
VSLCWYKFMDPNLSYPQLVQMHVVTGSWMSVAQRRFLCTANTEVCFEVFSVNVWTPMVRPGEPGDLLRGIRVTRNEDGTFTGPTENDAEHVAIKVRTR